MPQIAVQIAAQAADMHTYTDTHVHLRFGILKPTKNRLNFSQSRCKTFAKVLTENCGKCFAKRKTKSGKNQRQVRNMTKTSDNM